MQLQGPDSVGPAIHDMTARLGLPTRLAQLGVTSELFPRIIEGALADHSHRTNPRLASADDYLWMLERSL